jgi:predicted nuclease of predicted toxin-antitoxin system
MRFLIDANLPRAAIHVCQKFGHQVEFARDIGLAAASDAQIAEHARESSAALLTRDLDFADVRRYPPDQYPGIVVLRLPDTTVALEIARPGALAHGARISGATRGQACDCRNGPRSLPSPIERPD